VHDDDGGGAGAYRLLQRAGVKGEGAGLAIDEARPPAGVHDGAAGGVKRVGWDDDFAALDADGAQDNLDAGRAAVNRDGILRAAQGRELFFELLTVLPEGELPALQTSVDLLEDPFAVFLGYVDSSRRYAHEPSSRRWRDDCKIAYGPAQVHEVIVKMG
jgi:hypothetical protein